MAMVDGFWAVKVNGRIDEVHPTYERAVEDVRSNASHLAQDVDISREAGGRVLIEIVPVTVKEKRTKHEGKRAGGLAAAASMTPEQRTDRASRAARARWGKEEAAA
jgi:hypothetical protein